ncbi:hypothetical protein HDU93_008811 [Gonapodya sp. JEL0774]|nr:hypothetical protein HDU93_008811 [Gonapodya sp. JEL0774]
MTLEKGLEFATYCFTILSDGIVPRNFAPDDLLDLSQFDFLDAVESFPYGVASSFTAIREAMVKPDKAQTEISYLLSSLEELTPNQKIQRLESLAAALRELREHDERKMEATVRAQSMSERVVERLEDDLDRYDEEEKLSRRQAHISSRHSAISATHHRLEQPETKQVMYGRGGRERPQVDYQQASKRDGDYGSPGSKRRRIEGTTSNGGGNIGSSAGNGGNPGGSIKPNNINKPLDKLKTRRVKQQQIVPEPEPLPFVEGFEQDPDAGRLWCICQRPSFGEMIGCDNEDTKRDLIHGMSSKAVGVSESLLQIRCSPLIWTDPKDLRSGQNRLASDTVSIPATIDHSPETLRDSSHFLTLVAYAIFALNGQVMLPSQDSDSLWASMVLPNLSSQEPSVRTIILKGLVAISNSLTTKLRQISLQQKLILNLCDIATADEIPFNRNIALRLLGDACLAFRESVQSEVLAFGFRVSLTQLLRAFPPTEQNEARNLDFVNMERLIAPHAISAKVHALTAISRFFGLAHARGNEEFMRYIDRLFCDLLHPKVLLFVDPHFRSVISSSPSVPDLKVHKAIIIAVLQSLSQNLPLTNRNRLRVELFFRPLIRTLIEVFACPTTLTPPSTSSDGNPLESTLPSYSPSQPFSSQIVDNVVEDEMPSISSQTTGKDLLLPVLNRELFRFWAVWFPLPSDSAILKLSEDDLRKVGALGYVPRRKAFLKMKHAKNLQVSRPYAEGLGVTSVAFWERPRKRAKTIHRSANSAKVEAANVIESEDSPTPAAMQDDSFTRLHSHPEKLIDSQLLTFNLSQSPLVFNRHPLSHELCLRNNSTTDDVPFHLQVEPSKMFDVQPSFGIVPRHGTVPVRLTCTIGPNSSWPAVRGTVVEGWLKVRGGYNGWGMERLTLRAYLPPLLTVSARELDFGICPSGTSRTYPITVANLANSDVTVALAIPSKQKVFIVTPSSQIVLAARERKQIEVQFAPGDDSNTGTAQQKCFEEVLILVTVGGEVHRVDLKGIVGETLKKFDDQIDFGPVDIDYPSVMRHLLLENTDPLRSLPVGFETSTAEIVVNHGFPVLLRPRSFMKIPIEFRSNMSGIRKETLRVFAPGSSPREIWISAFSGPSVICPILTDICLGPVSSGSKGAYTVAIPVYNISPTTVDIAVAINSGTGFGVQKQMDREPIGGETVKKDAREWKSLPNNPEFSGKEGGVLELKAESRTMVELSFAPSVTGIVQGEIVMQVVYPRKELQQSFNLHSIVIGDTDHPQLHVLQSWWKNPHATPPAIRTQTQSFNITEQLVKNSEVFSFEQRQQLVLATDEVEHSAFELVTLTNISSEAQRFCLLLSYPFETDIPLDGSLNPGSSIDIPLRITAGTFDALAGGGRERVTAIGSICAMDGKHSLCTIPLYAAFRSMVTAETRAGTEEIKFAGIDENNKSTRKILIRNKSPWTVNVDCRVTSSVPRSADSERSAPPAVTASAADTTSFFSLSHPKMTLRPWDMVTLEVIFQGVKAGSNSVLLALDYVDPLLRVSLKGERISNNVKRKQQVLLVCCSCDVGKPSWVVEADWIDFGAVSTDEVIPRTLRIKSDWSSDANLLLAVSEPFLVVGGSHLSLKANRTSEVTLEARPIKLGVWNSLLLISGFSFTKALGVSCESGTQFITANVAVPIEAPHLSQNAHFSSEIDISSFMPHNTINLGIISSQGSATKAIEVINAGSLGVSITHISVQDPLRMNWTLTDERESLDAMVLRQTPSLFSYSIGSPSECREITDSGPWERPIHSSQDSAEIDFDEADFHNSEISGARGFEKGLNVLKRRRRLDVTTAAGGLKIPSVKSLFPISLRPKQNFELVLKVATHEQGVFQTSLRVDLERRAGEQSSLQLLVQGNAQPPLRLLEKRLDFSVRPVRGRFTTSLYVKNIGILQSRYFIESSDGAFTTEPEQGILEGDGEVEILVSFKPRREGENSAKLRIFGHSLEGTFHLDPVNIKLRGVGGYPELVCLTRLVDFGTALYMTPNCRAVTLQNKGLAEAEVQFTCSHSSVTLASGENGIIGPSETKDITIQYVPTSVEALDAKCFIKSSDSRGDYFMISLRGNVGIPKLEVHPDNFSTILDFGICSLGSKCQRELEVVNTGNIALNFTVELTRIQTSTKAAADRQHASELITITPRRGNIAVGQALPIAIAFTPTAMILYEWKLVINYEFHTIESTIRGFGGAAVVKIALPQNIIDFGVCRLGHPFKKIVRLHNEGNVGTAFHVRPRPPNADWSIYADELLETDSMLTVASTSNEIQTGSLKELTPTWMASLNAQGIRILTPDGRCDPESWVELVFEYMANSEEEFSTIVRIYHGNNHEEFTIVAKSAVPKLHMYSQDGRCLSAADSQPLDVGVHRVGSIYRSFLSLSNESPFGLDYFVQPSGLLEFDVSPQRGHVPANASVPIAVVFKPCGEETTKMDLRVLWEEDPLNAVILGSGGLGRLDIEYTEESDQKCGYLEFGMVPFNTSSEKRFYVCNTGMVEVSFHVLVDNAEFGVALLGEQTPLDERKKIAKQKENHGRRTTKLQWFASVSCVVSPSHCVELGANFTSKAPAISQGYVRVISDSGNKNIQVRGRGGTINIGHRGDLSFGDISSNFVYSRSLTLFNTGSIPAFCDLEWAVVGHNVEVAGGKLTVLQSYAQHDPRTSWARHQVLMGKNTSQMTRLSAQDYWRMIQLSILFDARNGTEAVEEIQQVQKLSKKQSSLSSEVKSVMQSRQKPGRAARMSEHRKRKQIFYQLISSSQLTSQSTARLPSFVKVEPTSILIPSYEEVSVNVELCLLTEDTFLATLLCRPQVPNTLPHEVALSATPKAVYIVCDDTRPLNFYRQPINEPETLSRTFFNAGHKDINFRLRNENPGLTISPPKGTLKLGQSLTVQFTFRAADENVQNLPIIFEPDCSQPIRFNFFGAGGTAKASLAKYRRFDFGHCMIGKNTTSFLPIANEGNAMLHLTKFELEETDTFLCGDDWPSARVSLPPGKTFNLPIVFNPQEESPPPGKLTVGTINERWTIELVGAGREAVLIISRNAMEYSDCIIGNRYEQRLDLKNVGDVEFPDLRVTPSTLTVLPFSEASVTVAFVPTAETKSSVVLEITSPYSYHRIPINLHAGSVLLEFSVESLDFGMFEKSSRPELKFHIKNVGTVKTSYQLKDTNRPSRFHITNFKGLLLPRKHSDLTITTVCYEVGSFRERLVLKTDLVNRPFTLYAHGQCEEALLKHNEFNFLNLGLCPVSDATSKILTWRNYGRFPLTWSMKFAYPVKVQPANGITLGGETSTCQVSWTPSGAYELRSAISLATNIGTFSVSVRGKALFPEIGIRSVFIDFGVCAIGTTYTETISITNKGKVPLAWQIPSPKDHYTLSKSEGSMLPRENEDIKVSFTPPSFGKFTSSLLVECKGINYKEIALLGVGGRMNLDIAPTTVSLVTKERTYDLIVTGYGIKVSLTENSRRLLTEENLSVLEVNGPFTNEISLDSVSTWIRQLELPKDLLSLLNQLRFMNSAADADTTDIRRDLLRQIDTLLVKPCTVSGVSSAKRELRADGAPKLSSEANATPFERRTLEGRETLERLECAKQSQHESDVSTDHSTIQPGPGGTPPLCERPRENLMRRVQELILNPNDLTSFDLMEFLNAIVDRRTKSTANTKSMKHTDDEGPLNKVIDFPVPSCGTAGKQTSGIVKKKLLNRLEMEALSNNGDDVFGPQRPLEELDDEDLDRYFRGQSDEERAEDLVIVEQQRLSSTQEYGAMVEGDTAGKSGSRKSKWDTDDDDTGEDNSRPRKRKKKVKVRDKDKKKRSDAVGDPAAASSEGGGDSRNPLTSQFNESSSTSKVEALQRAQTPTLEVSPRPNNSPTTSGELQASALRLSLKMARNPRPVPRNLLFPSLVPCRSVDSYEKLNRIAEGSYGVVYRARDKLSGEIVALKKLKLENERSGFPVTSLREIQCLLMAKHPNIVNVKEIVVGESLNNIFMVMEFIPHDLKTLMETMRARNTAFLVSEVKTLMLQLLSGVKLLHDLKTSNLLMTNTGHVKIADFGLARAYGDPPVNLTQLVVTLWYRAPELLLGEENYTPAIDIWSIGCIFGELINNEALMPGRGEIDQISKIFALLGSPDESIWPSWTSLPNARTINFTHVPQSSLRRKFPYLTQSGLDLLASMLCYDPARRITAEDAMRHPWFLEDPAPKDPKLFPSWPSVASGERKKAHSPTAPHAHHSAREVGEGEIYSAGAGTVTGVEPSAGSKGPSIFDFESKEGFASGFRLNVGKK